MCDNPGECQLLKLKEDLGLVLSSHDISDLTIHEISDTFFGIEPLMVVRDSPESGLGRLYFRDVFLCDTLENPSFFVDFGTYRLDITYSPKFKKYLPEFFVPGHSGLRMHQGNYIKDSSGCVLVGERSSDNVEVVSHSVLTLQRIIYVIKSLSIRYIKFC